MLIATAVSLSTILSDLRATVRPCSADECMLQVAELNTQVFRLKDAMTEVQFVSDEDKVQALRLAQSLCALRYSGYSDQFYANVRDIVRSGSATLAQVQLFPSGNGLSFQCPNYQP